MSSPAKDEGSVLEAEADAEDGQWARILGLLVLETPENSEDDEGGSPGTEGPKVDPEVAGAGGPVLWGHEGHPGTPADVDGHCLYHLGDEAATTILQQLTDRGDLRVHRYPSTERGGSVGPADWVGQQPEARGSGVWAGGLARSPLVPGTLPWLRAPEVGRAWGSAKRGAGGAKGSCQVAWAGAGQQSSAGDLGYWPSDSQSSEEFPFGPEMKVSIHRRRNGGGLLTPLSPQGAARELSSAVREELPSIPGSLPPSAPRRPAPGADRPSLRELDMFSRKPSVDQAKTASRPSYLPAAAPEGGLPKTPPRRKVAQEKRFSGGPARPDPLGPFLSWTQRGSVAPTQSGTFPPISGVPLPGKDRRNHYFPGGTKQSKHKGAGQKSLARRKRGSKQAVGENKDPKRDTGPKGPVSIRLHPSLHTSIPAPPGHPSRACHWAPLLCLLQRGLLDPGRPREKVSQGTAFPIPCRTPALKHRPGPSCPFGRRRECDSGDINIRAAQLPGHSQPLAMSQGEVLPRVPAPDCDPELLEGTPTPESWQQPPEAEGCPRDLWCSGWAFCLPPGCPGWLLTGALQLGHRVSLSLDSVWLCLAT
ncbi:uncharacterized protein CXorf49 homolog [Saccopteryx leptura]|uniref:uncharacterized protein CXorf49 homolog n=1 Tax=Saccopteryx leptura TaxID=249018 RepID=UPI00339CBA21